MTDGKKMDLILRALGYCTIVSLRKVSRRVDGWKRTGRRGRDADWQFLRDRGRSALDRCDGEEAGSEPSGLHHEELCELVSGVEGSRQKAARRR